MNVVLFVMPAESAGITTLTTASVDAWSFNTIEFSGSLAIANAGNGFKLQGSDDNITWCDLDGIQIIPPNDNMLLYLTLDQPVQRYIRMRIGRTIATAVTAIYARLLYPKRPDYSSYTDIIAVTYDNIPCE